MDSHIKILLIEDNPGDARLVEIYLRESSAFQFDLIHVCRLSDGLQLQREGNEFDVVLLDMTLPDSSGLCTIGRAIQAFSPHTAIIVLTGLDDANIGVQTVQSGAQDYLVKGSLDTTSLTRSVMYAIERKRMQLTLEQTARELGRSEKRLLQAQSIARIGNYELDYLTGEMYWSEEIYRILELNLYSVPAKLSNYLQAVPDSDLEKIRMFLQPTQIDVQHPFMIEHRIVSAPTGQVRYVINQGQWDYDENGDYKLVGAIQDITEYKYAKELLLQSEERYRIIFEESQDAIYISTPEGRFIEFNNSFVNMLGYSNEELSCLSIPNLYLHPSERLRLQTEIEKNGAIRDFEVNLRRKNGVIIDCLISATLWRSLDGSVRGYHGIARDVTAVKKNQELIKAKEIAEQSAAMKEQFLANMSHEIRTPLNVVIGMTHLLENSSLSNKQQEYLNALKISSDTLLKLINNILDLSKIESGKLGLEKSPFRLSDIINELVQTYKFKAREKGINLYTQMDASLPESVIGDSVRLHQILNNLVSNATKYTENGDIIISCRLQSETPVALNVHFSVKDTGIGIPKEKHLHIFESFAQAGDDTTRLYGGTGLGLSIAKKLVELFGGEMHLVSESGKGSTFSFIIQFDKYPHSENIGPLTPVSQHHAQAQQDAELVRNLKLEKLSVLLVEDNRLNQIVAKDLLKKWLSVVEVDIAENGKEAIKTLQGKKSYDIVLMDISMPIMDGYEATEYIRQQMPAPISEIPIVAMTAHAFNRNAEKCFEVGMNEFVSKPINPQTLYAKILKVVSPQLIQKPSNNKDINKKEQDMKTSPFPVASPTLINLEYLNSLSGDDETIKVIMLETLVSDLPGELTQLENDCKAADWNALKASAHKLKSTCAYMGLSDIQELAKQVENNAWDKVNLAKMPQMVEKIISTCQKAHIELKVVLKQMSSN